jgi:hypothetical protein
VIPLFVEHGVDKGLIPQGVLMAYGARLSVKVAMLPYVTG